MHLCPRYQQTYKYVKRFIPMKVSLIEGNQSNQSASKSSTRTSMEKEDPVKLIQEQMNQMRLKIAFLQEQDKRKNELLKQKNELLRTKDEVIATQDKEINKLQIENFNIIRKRKTGAIDGSDEGASSEEAPSSIHKKEEGKESRSSFSWSKVEEKGGVRQIKKEGDSSSSSKSSEIQEGSEGSEPKKDSPGLKSSKPHEQDFIPNNQTSRLPDLSSGSNQTFDRHNVGNYQQVGISSKTEEKNTPCILKNLPNSLRIEQSDISHGTKVDIEISENQGKIHQDVGISRNNEETTTSCILKHLMSNEDFEQSLLSHSGSSSQTILTFLGTTNNGIEHAIQEDVDVSANKDQGDILDPPRPESPQEKEK